MILKRIKSDWLEVVAVAMGGMIGSLLRYGTNHLVSLAVEGPYLLTATFIENMAGSFMIGWFFILLKGNRRRNHYLSRFLITGVAGSYTTYSAFMTDALLLAQSSITLFLLFILSSVAIGLLMVWVGTLLAERWLVKLGREKRGE